MEGQRPHELAGDTAVGLGYRVVMRIRMPDNTDLPVLWEAYALSSNSPRARRFRTLLWAKRIELIGDEVSRVVTWKSGSNVSRLAGMPIRLRFVMKDADVFALRFRESSR